MSVIRIEYCILGGNGGSAIDTGSGIIDRIIDSKEYNVTTTETIEDNFITPPATATHAILIGITGNTLVGRGNPPTANVNGKLVRANTECAITLHHGDKLSFKEST